MTRIEILMAACILLGLVAGLFGGARLGPLGAAAGGLLGAAAGFALAALVLVALAATLTVADRLEARPRRGSDSNPSSGDGPPD
jgi:hypothetical protein